MVLTKENYKEEITSYTEQDWKPLLDLIPKIEKVKKFGDYTRAMRRLKKGIIDMTPCDEHQVVDEFRKLTYEIPIIIDFNWGGWDEGREMVMDENFEYDSIDIPTKCKIITAIIRNDRFCSDRLVEAFETGMMLKVLKSIQKQLLQKKADTVVSPFFRKLY